jgi:hypothetical protein
MNRFRRYLLTTIPLALLVGLSGCTALTAPSPPDTIPRAVLADLAGALQAIANVLPALSAKTPPIIPASVTGPLLADIKEAQLLLSGIGADTPAQTGATVLARVEGYLNATLSVLAAVPVLPSPLDILVLAASVIVPEVEAWLASVIAAPPAGPPAPVSSLVAKAKYRGMTLAAARGHLGVAP